MTKTEARQYAKMLLSKHHLSEKEKSQFINFFSTVLQNKRKVLFYRSHPPELNLDFLVESYPYVSFFFPKIVSKTERKLEFIRPLSWKKGEYEIWEPEGNEKLEPHEADLCILPCLGCNSKGYRLGRGGGFYDRAMKNVAYLNLVGIALLELTNLCFQEEPHDLKFSLVVTPQSILKFS